MLAEIEKRVTWHHIPREGILFWQGVEEIVQGGAVGEAGVFAGGVQLMSVFAIRDSVVLEFRYGDFRELAARYPKRAWLDQQETRYRYVIYLADCDVSNWTRRCVRQADEVIALGIAEASPDMMAVEAEVLREEQVRRVETRKSLLLLHRPGKAMPGDTTRWLEPRTVDRHFHLRDLRRDEIDRIVRYVLQRELGLVLSGGGSRGFAHIGVLRAIREAGLSVDFIIGVSMGAIIGGRQALSGDIEQLVPRLKKMTRAFSDYTLPSPRP